MEEKNKQGGGCGGAIGYDGVGGRTYEGKTCNQKQIEYMVIAERLTGDLIEKVNAHLCEGWKLQGGIATDGFCLFQAITRGHV